MKRTILAGALLLAATTFASAQSAVVTTPGTTVVVEPEQRTHIHKYITERHVRPVTIKERVSVGTVLPSDVARRQLPLTEYQAERLRDRQSCGAWFDLLVDLPFGKSLSLPDCWAGEATGAGAERWCNVARATVAG
jgi:hypothetical protein